MHMPLVSFPAAEIKDSSFSLGSSLGKNSRKFLKSRSMTQRAPPESFALGVRTVKRYTSVVPFLCIKLKSSFFNCPTVLLFKACLVISFFFF